MKIAINGFGRIGRIFFRQAFEKPGIEIVAINDLSPIENLAYLLKYDTTYRRYEKDISIENNRLVVAGKEISVFKESDPSKLPWRDLNIDVVVESTGFFTTTAKAQAHIQAGAKKVIITAPAKDEVTPTSTPNLNVQALSENQIFSNASCTTNATNPTIAIMAKTIGVKKAILSTVHGYTATQALVDSVSKGEDFRRGRGGAMNIVPSTTGAAEATVKVLPQFKNKFDGVSLRVPTLTGSLVDLTFLSERPTTIEEVNEIFKTETKKPEWQGIVTTTEDQIVSSDIIGQAYGAIIDLGLTRVVDSDLVKVFSWYDNEWGYCSTLIKQIENLQNLKF